MIEGDIFFSVSLGTQLVFLPLFLLPSSPDKTTAWPKKSVAESGMEAPGAHWGGKHFSAAKIIATAELCGFNLRRLCSFAL